MKIRANGDILKYHPPTNTFGVMNAAGAPRTMFRPTDGMAYWLAQ
jgi:filamentous hemagglutinin